MSMMSAPNNSARSTPEGSSRAVLFKGEGWKKAATWSVVTFALSLGVGVIAWSWYLDGGSIWGSGFVIRGLRNKDRANEPTMVVPVVEVGTHRRAIDGVLSVEDEKSSMRYFAVMLDNITVARPQAGIAEASVVYEAPVEGGLTRFMAVFPETTDLERIGPVRSARPYFIDWALEYDALYAHVGGSPEALDKIKAVGLQDLNEMLTGGFFWRDSKRNAPHNAYTSGSLLNQALTKRFPNREKFEFRQWKFKDDADRAERADDQVVSIAYGHPNVDVVWSFDAETDTYTRKQGIKSLDERGAVVRVKNVVVLYMKIRTIDSVGRLRIETVGSGDALFLLDGNVFHGSWNKSARNARTILKDAGGNEIQFNAGPTWIQIVAVENLVTITP